MDDVTYRRELFKWFTAYMAMIDPAIAKTRLSNSEMKLFRRVRRALRRLALLELWDQACAYCGRHLSIQEVTVDHVLPRSRGSPASFCNVVPACMRCNREKSDELVFSFLKRRGWSKDKAEEWYDRVLCKHEVAALRPESPIGKRRLMVFESDSVWDRL